MHHALVASPAALHACMQLVPNRVLPCWPQTYIVHPACMAHPERLVAYKDVTIQSEAELTTMEEGGIGLGGLTVCNGKVQQAHSGVYMDDLAHQPQACSAAGREQ